MHFLSRSSTFKAVSNRSPSQREVRDILDLLAVDRQAEIKKTKTKKPFNDIANMQIPTSNRGSNPGSSNCEPDVLTTNPKNWSPQSTHNIKQHSFLFRIFFWCINLCSRGLLYKWKLPQPSSTTTCYFKNNARLTACSLWTAFKISKVLAQI